MAALGRHVGGGGGGTCNKENEFISGSLCLSFICVHLDSVGEGLPSGSHIAEPDLALITVNCGLSRLTLAHRNIPQVSQGTLSLHVDLMLGHRL